MKWRSSLQRRSRAPGSSHGIGKNLRGRGGVVTFLAIAGILGIVSGFAIADPSTNNGNPPEACGTNGATAQRIDPVNSGLTTSVAVIGGATLTFVFDTDHSFTWTADAPFTGTILVKSGSDQGNSGGGEFITTYTAPVTAGTVSSPFTNTNGQTLAISHVDVCGTGTTTHTSDTTLTTTLPNTTVTTTGPPTTSTVTGPPTTSTITGPPTTSTITLPGTTSTVSQDTTTTTTGPDTTLTTTVPCVQSDAVVTPRSLTTITIGGTTITSTQPGSTSTITEPGTTGTVTEPGSTQTVTEPGSTDVTTVPGSTIVSTIPGTTNTVTDCTTSTTSTTSSTAGTTTTGGVEGTTTSGGSTTSSVGGTTKKHGGGNGNGPAAGTVQNASGGLPFTGLHVPLLILLGLGMAVTGLVLRRRLGSLE
jgi:hypothetical protein